MYKLFLGVIVISSLLGCRHQTSRVAYQTGSIAAIFNKAREQNKKVFILFEDEQCGKCSYFANHLDSQVTTAADLNENYISYRVSVQDPQALPMAQIVKCPSYPFPYFFDNQGNLVAFGFPSSPVFDVNNLADISINEFTFSQLFRFSVSTKQYKQLVSQNLKAYLLLQQMDKDIASTKHAYDLNKASLDIAVYPYNLYLHESLSKQLNLPMATDSFNLSEFNNSDRLIYKNLLLDTSYFIKHSQQHGPDGRITYKVSPENLSLTNVNRNTSIPFSIKVKNTGQGPLVIKEVGHPCSCIDVKWSKTPVQPDSTTYISGIFQAPPEGSFSREIYLHTNSASEPMKILMLSGNVK